MNAAAIATAANPSTVERNGRCEVIGFSIQFFVETGVSRRGNYEPQIRCLRGDLAEEIRPSINSR
jgi:hypothetical protein